MAKKENQRIILTKRLLQEGLLRLLEAKDLDKISVTELCRESGINRATFYNHYSSPQDLLLDLENQMVEELDQLMIYPQNTEEALIQLESVCTYMQEHARSVIILSRCHADTDLADSFHKLNSDLAPRRPRSKLTSNMDDDCLHLTTTFIYTGCYHLIREWLAKDIQKTPREIAELLLTIISKEIHYI
jgi:AcrR family transcriptional regulator